MTNYYDKSPALHTDGTVMRGDQFDDAAELEVRTLLSIAWSCEVHPWPKMYPLDCYFTRHERLVALGEIKVRNITSTQFSTVYLSFRKWSVLMEQSSAADVQGLFIVGFNDLVGWVECHDIDPRNPVMLNAKRKVTGKRDREMVIPIPVEQFRTISRQL